MFQKEEIVSKLAEETPGQSQQETENTVSGVSGCIKNILEESGEEDNKINKQSREYLKLEKFLKRFLSKNFKKLLWENVGEYHFLEKYFDKNKRNGNKKYKENLKNFLKNFLNQNFLNIFFKDNKLKLNGRFYEKFERYFSIHKNILINYILEEVQKKGNFNKVSIKNILENNFLKYINIIFVFGEKIQISKLDFLMKKSLEEIVNIKDNYDNKLEKLKQNNNSNIDAIAVYRTISGEFITKENFQINITQEIKEKTKELFISQVEELYNIFYKWKKTPFLDKKDLKRISLLAKDFFDLALNFKNSGIAFSEDLEVGKISKVKEKEKFLNNFVNTFFDKIDARVGAKKNTIREENREAFIDFLKMSLNYEEGKNEEEDEKNLKIFTPLIKDFKEYKKNKYKQEIPDSKEEKTKEELEKIKQDFGNLDFSVWYELPDNQQLEIFFEKILYKKDDKLFLNTSFLQIEKIDNTDIKIFAEYSGVGEKLVKEQLEKIKDNFSSFSSIEDFINNDVNDLNLLWDWFKFILKKKGISSKNKEINLENIKKIEDKSYGVVNRIVEKIEELGGLKKLEFMPGNDRLVNESSKSIEKLCHDIKIKFEKGPVDIDNSIENFSGGKIKFKDYSSLYIQENYKQTISYNKLAMKVCNKLMSSHKIEDEEEKEYLQLLISLKIIPKDIENLQIKDLDNLAQLKEFLKYVHYNAKILEEMIEIGNKDGKILQDFLPKNETDGTGVGPIKDYSRGLEKLIKEHNGDFAPLGDFSRMRIVNNGITDTIESVVDFIKKANDSENITQLSIIDSTKHPLAKPKKASGYRDIKILVKFKDGNVGEVQFLYKDMFEIKEKGINLEEENNDFVFEKFKQEQMLFSDEEIKELIEISSRNKIKLPKKEILEKMCENRVIFEKKENMDLYEVSTQSIYNLARFFEEFEEGSVGYNIWKKLARFERILADIAWGKIVNIYLKNVLGSKENIVLD